ncbi:DNA adenine methylase [Elizabethkingia anophelis]|uniref:DNA adenine methylase n=1 Tax=Elizabethkingia anophelis TaxID=1117645 RepID=UPI0012B1B3DD|nr:DNA adenine methylase [Elizabethkingia anophelis]QGN22508.1 DNA adenine methylase [Elizabethkingia anophelis]QNV09160.1 DNA adenine methylase [Elizabethkingia anophelis]UTF90916.1 DNA adenine methylase [Elizabethkingia anophelis]UTG01786.1 DNA adenine methylase [Elizabethkingia anophelis]UTG05536.1 DNA adenine methylase [Elizabethkingia anophelis]
MIRLRTPISYYGGKQKLAARIVSLIPRHTLYCEPFVGGAAIFFAKRPSKVEVINDTNRELVNFYRITKEDFAALEAEIRTSLHSRDLHRKAWIVYNNPDMFTPVKRAWAVWILSTQSFSGMLDGSWGFDIGSNTTTRKISTKRDGFTKVLSKRLSNCQLECADALYVIASRDTPDSFFYCDPPYYNSDLGHYDGYSQQDYEELLYLLSRIQGKFLLSSYPSPPLQRYIKEHGWQKWSVRQKVSVNAKGGDPKTKTEMLVANYPIGEQLEADFDEPLGPEDDGAV